MSEQVHQKHVLACVGVCVGGFRSVVGGQTPSVIFHLTYEVCVCVHLWADDSLDVLQRCVGRGGRAVWCGPRGAVAMVTKLWLCYSHMG